MFFYLLIKTCQHFCSQNHVAKLDDLCNVSLQEKGKLEEEIRKFKRDYPNKVEVLAIIERYRQIYTSCVGFDDDDEGNIEVDKTDAINEEGNIEADKTDAINDEGNVKTDKTDAINIYQTQDPSWMEAAVQVADAVEFVNNEVKKMESRQVDDTDEMPSFKLISQESSSAAPKLSNIGDDSVQKEVLGGDVQRLKREAKLSRYDRSPWLERVVDLTKGLTKEEKMIWDYLLEGSVDEG